MDVMRRSLLALLVLGLSGIGVELVLFKHYEDALQVIPLALIAMTFVTVGWHLADGRAAPLRTLQVIMGLIVMAGMVGLITHYRGNIEFQLEVDPTLHGWPLFVKAIHAKAPPALAPGSMSQLGLLGLLYTYRHPALASRRGAVTTTGD